MLRLSATTRLGRLCSLVFVLFIAQGQAAEVDNFSGRGVDVQVANREINRLINLIISEKVIDKYNSEVKEGCNREKLLEILERVLDRNTPDIYQSFIWESPPITGPASYDEFAFAGKFKNSASIFFTRSYKVNLGGQTVLLGLDKLDHFFGHGYLYWKMLNGKRVPAASELEVILKIGDDQEESTWGLKSFGIKSYGDLSANYLGLAFWQNVVDGPDPHVACVKGRYEFGRYFRLEDYLDASVDEGVNCSSFSTPEIKADMMATEVKLAGKSCPLEPSTCAALTKKYPLSIAKHILHPLCRGEAHDRLEETKALTTAEVLENAQRSVSGATNFLKMFFPPSPREMQRTTGSSK